MTISLVMTVYNREKYLKEAIESVLQQTRNNFELLVWDDGSRDNSVAIAQSFRKQDSRVRVIIGKHSGHSKSLKSAIAATKGSFIGQVDSDDILDPTALDETAKVLEKNRQVGLVYTNYLLIDECSRIIGEGDRCKIPYSKERILSDFMTFHFRLIRRTAFDEAGGINTNFVYAQDYDLCLRLSEITEVRHVNKPLYFYRTHVKNISHQKKLEQIYFMEKAALHALERRRLAKSPKKRQLYEKLVSETFER